MMRTSKCSLLTALPRRNDFRIRESGHLGGEIRIDRSRDHGQTVCRSSTLSSLSHARSGSAGPQINPPPQLIIDDGSWQRVCSVHCAPHLDRRECRQSSFPEIHNKRLRAGWLATISTWSKLPSCNFSSLLVPLKLDWSDHSFNRS